MYLLICLAVSIHQRCFVFTRFHVNGLLNEVLNALTNRHMANVLNVIELSFICFGIWRNDGLSYHLIISNKET